MKLVLSTIPPKDAKSMARTLVNERLVAGVSIVPLVESIYWWNGEVREHGESVLIIRTTDEMVPQLLDRIRSLHSYEVPEIVSLDIDENSSNTDYVKWVMASVIGQS